MKKFFQKKEVKIFLVVLFLVIFLGLNIYSTTKNKDKLRVTFFDIGQGDSAFIQTPEGIDILIDGGPDKTVLKKLRKVMPFYDKHIDYLIITHEHEDHITGALEVMQRYQVDKVFYNKSGEQSNVYPAIFQGFLQKGTQLVQVADYQEIKLTDQEKLTIYSFLKKIKDTSNINNTSLLEKFSYGSTSFLFMADLESSADEAIFKSGLNLKADILKVSHHGSVDANSEKFLQAVNPKVAIISVGVDNKFGHPSRRIIKRLGRDKIKVYRTDLDGDIIVVFDKKNNYAIYKEK